MIGSESHDFIECNGSEKYSHVRIENEGYSSESDIERELRDASPIEDSHNRYHHNLIL